MNIVTSVMITFNEICIYKHGYFYAVLTSIIISWIRLLSNKSRLK